MKKRGFTLIELLAVIVILAVIALVITPLILNLINTSKRGTAEASVMGYVHSVEKYYIEAIGTTDQLVADSDYMVLDVTPFLKTTGAKPTAGNFNLKEDGLVGVGAFCMNGFYITYNGEKAKVDPTKTCDELKPKSLITELKGLCFKTNESGLIEDDEGNCFYRGTRQQIKDNYVWFGGHEWRIVAINKDNTLTLTTEQPLTSLAWQKPGIQCTGNDCNTLTGSNIQNWIDEVFLKALPTEARSKLQMQTITKNSLSYTGKVRLLESNEILKARIQLESFLHLNSAFFDSALLSDDYSNIITSANVFNGRNPREGWDVRPTIRISDFNNKIGSGTKMDPYREQGEKKAKNSNDIIAGSYIEVPTAIGKVLVRTVRNDSEGLKVTLNGLLDSPAKKPAISFDQLDSNSELLQKLNQFLNSVSSNLIDTSNHYWRVGTYEWDFDQSISTITYEGPIGLPIIGELFSGNDIDVSNSSKIFVDSSLLVNSNVATSYWFMNCTKNPFTGDENSAMEESGELNWSINSTEAKGIRPVFYLKRGLEVTGSGTAYDPYRFT